MGYKTAIIGAGIIGAFADVPQSENILSHAHGITENNNFTLLGIYDIDAYKCNEAAKIWNCKGYTCFEDIFLDGVQVVVLAVADTLHFEYMKSLKDRQLKLIILEKPLATDLQDAKMILEEYSNIKTKVVINYTRRFVPELILEAGKILKGAYGDFISGNGYYGKGFFHNGTHMIDLIRMMVCDVEGIRYLNEIEDYTARDPSVSGIVELENHKIITLHSVDSRKFTIFELDLLFSKGRIRITDVGLTLEVYSVEESEVYSGYYFMEVERRIKTQHSRSLRYLYENVYQVLEGKGEALCSLEDGYKALKACWEIRR